MAELSILLRPFKEDDYLHLNEWRHDQDLQKMTGGPIRWVSLSIEKEWVHARMMDNSKNIYWAICTNDDFKKMIGYISLNAIDHLNKSADAGGTVIGDQDYRNGNASFEALLLVLDYAFNQLNMHRISAACLSDHYFAPHSLSVFGFQKEGTFKEEIYKNGKYHDVDHYSLLREDYDKLNAEGQYNIEALTLSCAKHIRQTKKNK